MAFPGPSLPQAQPQPRWQHLPWWMAIGCFSFGLLDTWLLVSLGLEFTFKEKDATLIIAVFLTFSFGFFGYFWGQALAATRRERLAAQAKRDTLMKLAEVQGRVAHKEKMAALGQVVASVAHEVRNPLAIIRSQIQNLSEEIHAGESPDPQDLEIILEEINRLGRVVEEIGHFSRPIQPRSTFIHAADILDRVAFMVGSLYKDRQIAALRVTDRPAISFQSDPDLVCQALMTFVINGVEVNPVDKQVSLSVDQVDDWIQFHITDHGPGIPEDLRGQIMAPFYTTKSGGTGLGLAIAYDIIKALRGEIIIADGLTGGTQFSLVLPNSLKLNPYDGFRIAGASMNERILIVDDEKNMARAIAKTLERRGYQCFIAGDGVEALKVFENQGADLVLTDMRMPRMDGLTLMAQLHETHPQLPVILVTAYGGIPSAVKAIKDGAFDYVTKPFDHTELHALVARALKLNRLESENRVLRQQLGGSQNKGMVAESQAMQQVLNLVDRAANSNATILITGESGTGKEVIARRVHVQSPRISKPFLAVNCKAFAEGVLESELFGHEKGAFTGAHATRLGCFERAHGGTLFLDEIGETPPSFQAKLLRVLQEREVLRVGGTQPRKVDVRIIAATNRKLAEAVRDGAFREDLYFRLNVIPIELPPLRDRPEDILPLVHHFLSVQTTNQGRHFVLSPEARAALEKHTWPGNVRELENTIERATVLARTDVIEQEDLLLDHQKLPQSVDQTQADQTAAVLPLQEAMDVVTRESIQKALAATGNRKAEAAVLLGVDRTTLYRLMKKLGFSKP